MKFKTIVHRVSYADDLDKDAAKQIEKIQEEGGVIKEIKTACGENHIVMQFFYEDKKKSGQTRSAKA